MHAVKTFNRSRDNDGRESLQRRKTNDPSRRNRTLYVTLPSSERSVSRRVLFASLNSF